MVTRSDIMIRCTFERFLNLQIGGEQRWNCQRTAGSRQGSERGQTQPQQQQQQQQGFAVHTGGWFIYIHMFLIVFIDAIFTMLLGLFRTLLT